MGFNTLFVARKIRSGIYKVTGAEIKKTAKGNEIFRLQLDNSFWATKLAPSTTYQQKSDSLYIKYAQNNKSFDFLIGKFAELTLEETNYGTNFLAITSYDILSDFKNLLDKSNGKAFTCRNDIYNFLLNRGYPVNPDNSITLKEPYEKFNIIGGYGSTGCYPNAQAPGTLTRENIDLIYDEFFKDKQVDTHDYDRSEEYGKTSVSIIISGEKFHKSQSKTVASYTNTVMSIGDKLTKEQEDFLSRTHAKNVQV